MKLNELTVTGDQYQPGIEVREIHPHLNVVHSERPDSLSMFRRVLHQVLFGDEADCWQDCHSAHCNVVVSRHGHRYRLTRSMDSDARMTVEGLDTTRPIESAQELLGQMDGVLFDGVFCIDFSQAAQHLKLLVPILERRIGQAEPHPRFRSRSEYEVWHRQALDRASQLERTQSRLIALEKDRDRFRMEIEGIEASARREREQLTLEIQRVDSLIATSRHELEGHRRDMADVEREVADLHLLMERQSAEKFVPADDLTCGLESLYVHFDQLDDQILRWQKMQTSIQDRRVSLRDEMEVWNELSDESDQHPGRICGELIKPWLQAVEAVDHSTRAFAEEHSEKFESLADFAKETRTRLGAIREGIDSLDDEFIEQFRVVRQRLAVDEFKYLRECFEATAEHLDAVRDLRESLMERIRQVDPAGCELLLSATPEFLKLAASEGSWKARCSLLESDRADRENLYRKVLTDLTAERQALRALEIQRKALTEKSQQTHTALNVLLAERDSLAGRLQSSPTLSMNESQDALRRVIDEIESVDLSIRNLSAQVDEDRRVPPLVQDRTMQRAEEFLRSISQTADARLRLAPDGSGLQYSPKGDPFEPIVSANTLDQAMVLLAIVSATCETFAGRGTEGPMVVGNLDAWIEAGQFNHLLRFLQKRSFQTIVLCRTRDVPASWLTSGLSDDYRTLAIVENAVARSGEAWRLTPYSDFVPQPINWREQNLAAYVQPQPAPLVYREDFDRFHSQRSAGADLSSAPVQSRPRVRADREQYPALRATPPQSSFALVMSDETPLRNVDLVDSIHLHNLASAGINNFRSLLELDPENLPPRLQELGLEAGQIDRWQAQAWMLLCVPGLLPSETRLLIACGIVEPEQLEATNSEQLLARINRYLASPDGQRLAHGESRFNQDRLNEWYRALEGTRSRWRHDTGYSRRRNRQPWQQRPVAGDNSPAAGETHGRYFSRERRRHTPGVRYFDGSQDDDDNREAETLWSQYDQPDEKHAMANGSYQREFGEVDGVRDRKRFAGVHVNNIRISRNATATIDEPDRKAAENSNASDDRNVSSALRFHLNLSDQVEAAPSIGPKTAERFTNIGIQTIGEFLKMTADAMAEKIAYKRINADVIRAWQHQARLVCRIPNLRGHDAQLLVGCGIIEPEELASMTPKQVLALVGPFADTKEGLKIIRSGKKPDLKEVSDWIQWAKNTRSIMAA